jgi:hypothetical protein
VSHVLSQHYGYRVMAVEGNEDYSDKGVARVQSISTRIRKRVVEAGTCAPSSASQGWQ